MREKRFYERPRSLGEREVRGGQWDQNTLCAAQRAPARCGVRFALKIAPNTALGPRTKPQCHLARCYRRLGSIVEAHTERSQQKRQRKQWTGERQVVSAAPQINSGGAWTDSGPGS